MLTATIRVGADVNPDEIGTRTAAYLADKWQAEVAVDGVDKVFGGASRETYILSLQVDGEPRRVVVRRDPPSSLIDTERSLEFNAYAAVFPTDIPVPEPLFLENDPAVMGQPFSVMAAIEGAVSDIGLLDEDGKRAIGEEKWTLMGKLAAKDPVELGFDKFMPVPPPGRWVRGAAHHR